MIGNTLASIGQPQASEKEIQNRARIREAAEAFEAMLLQLMLKAMRQAQLEEGFFGKGPGAGTYDGMFDQAMSDSLAGRNPLGIADMLEARWSGDFEKAGDGSALPTPEWVERLKRAQDAYGTDRP